MHTQKLRASRSPWPFALPCCVNWPWLESQIGGVLSKQTSGSDRCVGVNPPALGSGRRPDIQLPATGPLIPDVCSTAKKLRSNRRWSWPWPCHPVRSVKHTYMIETCWFDANTTCICRYGNPPTWALHQSPGEKWGVPMHCRPSWGPVRFYT